MNLRVTVVGKVKDKDVRSRSESEREYKVEVAAPGMTKEDFNIHIDEDNNLVILSLIHIYSGAFGAKGRPTVCSCRTDLWCWASICLLLVAANCC